MDHFNSGTEKKVKKKHRRIRKSEGKNRSSAVRVACATIYSSIALEWHYDQVNHEKWLV